MVGPRKTKAFRIRKQDPFCISAPASQNLKGENEGASLFFFSPSTDSLASYNIPGAESGARDAAAANRDVLLVLLFIQLLPDS